MCLLDDTLNYSQFAPLDYDDGSSAGWSCSWLSRKFLILDFKFKLNIIFTFTNAGWGQGNIFIICVVLLSI